MTDKYLEECFEPGFNPKLNFDPPEINCNDNDPRFTDIAGRESCGIDRNSPFSSDYDTNEGLGHARLCDPMTTGQIVNDPHDDNFNRSTIYRYAKGLRGTDEAVKSLFENIVVLDPHSKVFKVPLIWGTQERAVAVIVQENVRKDNSLVVDRIRLPIMSIYGNGHAMTNDRYMYHGAIDYYSRLTADNKPAYTIQEERHPRDTAFGLARGIPVNMSYKLTIWTKYMEDMNMILTQIYTKFSGGIAYIRIQGVTNWEPVVKLESIANNINTEPGDKQERIIKYEINMTAEGFVPQPIQRRKTVLKTVTEVVDGLKETEIHDVLARLEDAIKGLE